jgi:hypothetical protein
VFKLSIMLCFAIQSVAWTFFSRSSCQFRKNATSKLVMKDSTIGVIVVDHGSRRQESNEMLLRVN